MTLDTNKMAQKVQEALIQASALAERHRQSELEPEHLLLVMLGQPGGIIPQILAKLSIPAEAVMAEVRRSMLRLPTGAGENSLAVSPRLRYLLMNAQEEAERFGDAYISGEHILLALVVSAKGKRGAKRAQSGITREVGDILLAYGVNQDAVMSIFDEIRRVRQTPQEEAPSSQISALEQCGRNLVALARERMLDPVVCRQEEVSMILQVLSQKTRNCPVLVGGSGVGKTSIVEGLAQSIALGEVPASFYNHEIVSLDRDALITGIKTRGELEERFAAVLREAIENPKVILFIDDLDVCLGSSSEGNLDLAGILMPLLNRFDLKFIAACSQQVFESANSIRMIPDFANHFQPIMIHPPSVDETILILRELRPGYENHHGVGISDEALVAASILSNKYIADRFLPEKAIDLIDEAAARLRMELRSADPMALMEMSPSQPQMENDNQMRMMEMNKANHLAAIADMRNRIEEVQGQIIQAQNSFDNLRAADLQLCTLPNLEAELALMEQKAYAMESPQIEKPSAALHGARQVTEEDIQALVSQFVGLPPERIISNPAKKINDLEQIINERLVGQKMAVEEIANAIRRAHGGFMSPKRPLGSYLFLGPSGVGKTVMAKVLAEVLYGSELKVVRLDLSMYADQDAIVRLIGDPAAGADAEPGHLIEIIQRDPEIVLILDAIEKAHVNVQSLLQQIMEDGYLSDGDGEVLSFTDTMLVMKCGVGSEIISQMPGPKQAASILPALQLELSHYLKQDFLASLDEVIIFRALDQHELIQLIDLSLRDIKYKWEEKGISLRLSEAAYRHLIAEANVAQVGAKMIRRTLQRKIQNPITIKMMQGHFSAGVILVEVSDQSGELIFTPG